MIKNYFKIAWRNLVKDRQFTFLNLLGLSTGLACALLIWLWVTDERNVDRFNEKDSQLYQVMQNIRHEDRVETMTHTAGLLAPALAREMPEVEFATTVVPASWFDNKGIATVGESRLKAGGQFVGKNYFDVFSCRFTEGSENRLLEDKRSVAISDELAMKLFHQSSKITGKTIQWSNGEFTGTYSIAGIFPRNASNMSDKFDILFNFDLFAEKRPGILDWGNSDPSTFVILKKGTNLQQFNAKIEHFINKNVKETGTSYFAVKFSERYLHGIYKNGKPAGGRIAYVKLFSVIGLFILVIACINFMNLSTAKASGRIKEVGIQKVVGARRPMLVAQYLGESVLMSFLALSLAIVWMALLLPVFNNITDKSLSLQFNSNLTLSVLGITLLTGLVAGSYPALYISRFSPALVLKGKLKSSPGELWVRRGLVVFQFTLSIVAIVGVTIVYQQINYIQSRNLGYSRDNIIHFEIPLEFDSAKLVASAGFVNELKNLPGVVSAASYGHNLTGEHGEISGFQWPGKNPGQDINFANLEVGYGFIETVGIKMKEGRNFSNNERSTKEIVFNESAIQAMGLTNPIGKMVKFWDQERQIVGVAADFNFESLYQGIKPCFFQVYPVMPNIIVKIKAGTEKQTIARIRTAFTSFNKGLAFEYRFMDEEYQALYNSENRVATLSKYFAGLAILISCLGLFGLAAFTAQRRQKEIGIRKVVGASASQVAVMLSTDFVKMVLLAILVGFPLVAWIMHNWLLGFAYRINIRGGVFIITGLAILLITFCTVSFQAIRAALANPVKSLRTE